MEIRVTNVNQALSTALIRLKQEHDSEPSRNGPVWVFPEPVMTIYSRPWERVLFSPMRNANPFFHLMESLWMLAGRNDIAFPAYFAKNLQSYSDDGQTQHGAYGYRWRTAFIVDQLDVLAELLAKDPTTRRAVLGMWSPHIDLVYACDPANKDAPCNTHAYLDARNGKLNLTVCCRSNDLWWGAYGANAVHFSVLQEFMASYAGYPVGEYRQFSNNLHLYTENVDVKKIDEYALNASCHDYYNMDSRIADVYPLVQNDAQQWLRDLRVFMKNPLNDPRFDYVEPFFTDVAIPMYRVWWARKEGHKVSCEGIQAPDWRRACQDWITRADAKKAAKVGT